MTRYDVNVLYRIGFLKKSGVGSGNRHRVIEHPEVDQLSALQPRISPRCGGQPHIPSSAYHTFNLLPTKKEELLQT